MSERKIIAYTVIVGESSYALLAKVNPNLSDGWEPHGSLVVCHENNIGTTFYQAMVKYAGD